VAPEIFKNVLRVIFIEIFHLPFLRFLKRESDSPPFNLVGRGTHLPQFSFIFPPIGSSEIFRQDWLEGMTDKIVVKDNTKTFFVKGKIE